MQLPKKVWIGVVVLALTGMLTGILAPNAAHSIVSTLVTVVNTPAQPVPTLSTEAQTAFVASNSCEFGTPFGTPPVVVPDACPIPNLYAVPAGKTAVIESASGVCVTKPTTATREFQLTFGPAATPVQLSFVPSPALSAVGTSTANIPIAVSTTAQNLKSYAVGGATGTSITFIGYATANQTGATFPNCTFTVSGYLVSTP